MYVQNTNINTKHTIKLILSHSHMLGNVLLSCTCDQFAEPYHILVVHSVHC